VTFNRKLPFVKTDVLRAVAPHLTLGAHVEPHRSIPVDILSVKETLAQVKAGKENTAR